MLSKIPNFEGNKNRFISWCVGSGSTNWTNIGGAQTSGESQDVIIYYQMRSTEWSTWGTNSPTGSFLTDDNNDINIENISRSQFIGMMYELSYINNRAKHGITTYLNTRSSYIDYYFTPENSDYSNKNFENVPSIWLTYDAIKEMKKTIVTIFLMIKHTNKFNESDVNFGVF
jgi:hypothetical protein